MAVIETEFGFFEVEVEGSPRDTFELCEAMLGRAPKGLDAVDVVFSVGELILSMTDAKVFRVPDIDQAVVADPAIGVDDRVEADFAPDYLLQRTFLGIWNDLSPYMITTFQNAEDDGFLARTSTSFSFDSVRSEVGLVDLDCAADGRLGVADRCQPSSDLQENLVHRPHADACHPSCRARCQVLTETAKDVPKSGLRNFRRSVVLVNPHHHRSIALLRVRYAS